MILALSGRSSNDILPFVKDLLDKPVTVRCTCPCFTYGSAAGPIYCGMPRVSACPIPKYRTIGPCIVI